MSRLRVFQTVVLPPAVQDVLEAELEIVHAQGAGLIEELASLALPVDVVLGSISDMRLDAATIRALPPSIRAVATYSVGLDHIDLDAASERGLAVFNTPGALDDSVADAAMFLILGAARRGNEAQALIREDRWTGWTPRQLIGFELAGRTLGILGMGGIGVKVAARAAAFGMQIAYTNRRPSGSAAPSARFMPDADELVRSSDVLVLACPSTAETRRFLDARRLDLAKPELIVVNIGRGDLVDDDALIAALRKGRIFAAGLDVFDREPAVHPGYKSLPNVFLTPHIGSSTLEARVRMGLRVVEGLKQWNAGEPAPSRVI